MQPPEAVSQRSRRVLLFTVCIQCGWAVAGCGGEASQRPPEAPVRDPSLAGEPAVPECDAVGINQRVGRHGTCVTGGVTRTVANRRQRLVIDDEIEIRLADLAVRPRGRDRLVVAWLRVRNLATRRLRWPVSARQVALWIDERLISQDPDRRLLALRTLGPRGKPTVTPAPGRASTVAAGWRLSPAAAARLRSRGSAIIVVPPHDGGRSVDDATRVGVLRLWK